MAKQKFSSAFNVVTSLRVSRLRLFFFFFQAEDGIRDVAVTGVQTCALPICHVAPAGCGLWRLCPPGQRKIETDFRAVKPRVDLRLYRGLHSPFPSVAEVVELVDALASGASGRKPVGVRVPPSALLVSWQRRIYVHRPRVDSTPQTSHFRKAR